MIDRQILMALKFLHGSYNFFMMCFFFYQGWTGYVNRRGRIAGNELNHGRIKRHRKLGKALALLGPAGFFAGTTLTYMDYGYILKYPLHFFTGSGIAILIITTFFISKQIKGQDSPWRKRHYKIGIIILCLYVLQITLGLKIIF